jgi:acyl-coenzyme A synthetase/AMP-(fatty) acid ligase
MALIQDGYIYIYGRADDIFNVGGEKISPLEIEHVLNRHEAIETSGVVGVPDEQRGNIAVAFIKTNNHLTRKQLIEFQKEWLPPSHIPQRYFEIRDMPMTTNGKIQRKKLTIEDQQRIIREIS